MQVNEFREKVKPNVKITVEGKDFVIKEVVKFRFDDGTFYIKCWLSDDYVLADDLNENMFILVKETKTDFKPPFHEKVEYENKEFKFLYKAHAVAEEISGEEVFKKGDSESFWDFKADDNSYLSLGVNDQTNERQDFYGKIVDNNLVNVK
jgi:hypothetical protein